jgi:ribonuclease HI
MKQKEDWTHPADSVRITEHNESKDYTFHIYTDGSKNEHGVGSGMAINTKNELTHQIKHILHNRCSNNQAEQTAILKALHKIEILI